MARLTKQVAAAVETDLKGRPREEVRRAVYQAHKDVSFLFYLHQQVNSKLITEERHYWTRAMLLVKGLQSLLREQALD